MTTNNTVFTSHQQVNDYLETCYASGMCLENHTFYVNSQLMNKYMYSNDPVIQEWKEKHLLTVTCRRKSKSHPIIIDFLDDGDASDYRETINEVFQGKMVLNQHDQLQDLFKITKRLQIPIKNQSFYIDRTLKQRYLDNPEPEMSQWLEDYQLVINPQEGKGNLIDNFKVTIQPENPYHLWNMVEIGKDNQTYLDEYDPDQLNGEYPEDDQYDQDTVPLLGLRQRTVSKI